MIVNGPILLTPEGKIRLEAELERLCEQERPRLQLLVKELSEAGDVSDDSDFEATKEELMRLEGRIREIQLLLEEAEIVQHQDGGSDVVEFGSTVTVVDGDDIEDTWVIVGPQEANAAQGRISHVSPVGSALLGKRVGEQITVRAPGGEIVFTVTGVR